MTAHVIKRQLLLTGIYVVTAAYCWLIPSRLTGADGTVVINTYPTHAFALASAALVVVHIALSLRGRLAVAVAAIYAVATISTVSMFVLLLFIRGQRGACLNLPKAGLWQRRGVALARWPGEWARSPHRTSIHLLARSSHWALCCWQAVTRTTALRLLGVLRPPEGLAQMAAVTADLTVSLWIASTVLLSGGVIYAALPWRVRLNAA